MPAPATPVTAPAAASAAVADLVTGLPCRGRRLGASRRATWFDVGGHVLVVSDRHAVRLPNAVMVPMLPPDPWTRPSAGGGVAVGDVTVGDGIILGPGWQLGVVRWWDARPHLGTVEASTLRRVVERSCPESLSSDGLAIRSALAAGDGAALRSVATRIIGKGGGLTPAGDDLLAGALATYRLLGGACGMRDTVALVDEQGHSLVVHARSATTALSASLLAHAVRGEVADPVAMLLRALAESKMPEMAMECVAAIGHSSGPALLEGVMVGAAAVCGVAA